tara:strand:+ start:279 stop:1064 length:786 start_codon:yes stop_codon:yes gene_type:complete
MVKQIKYLFFIIICSFLFTQDLIKTKEFTFFKTYNDNGIDFNQILDLNSSIYRVEVINISSINKINHKKTIVPKCDADIVISFDSKKNKVLFPAKSDVQITAESCDGKFNSNGFLFVDKDNSFANITASSTTSINDIEFELTLWISGKFNEAKQNYNESNNGYLREWYDDGSLYIEYQFTNGKKNGVQKKWYKNGQQEILYYYKKGKLEGAQKKWHKNGALKFKINYKNDVQHGKSEEWLSDGTVKHTKIFDNGILIKQVN